MAAQNEPLFQSRSMRSRPRKNRSRKSPTADSTRRGEAQRGATKPFRPISRIERRHNSSQSGGSTRYPVNMKLHSCTFARCIPIVDCDQGERTKKTKQKRKKEIGGEKRNDKTEKSRNEQAMHVGPTQMGAAFAISVRYPSVLNLNR